MFAPSKEIVRRGKLPQSIYGQFKLDAEDDILGADEITEKYIRKFMARGHTRLSATKKVEGLFKRYEKYKEEQGFW